MLKLLTLLKEAEDAITEMSKIIQKLDTNQEHKNYWHS